MAFWVFYKTRSSHSIFKFLRSILYPPHTLLNSIHLNLLRAFQHCDSNAQRRRRVAKLAQHGPRRACALKG